MGCAGSKLATASPQVAPHSFEQSGRATEQTERASRISYDQSWLERAIAARQTTARETAAEELRAAAEMKAAEKDAATEA